MRALFPLVLAALIAPFAGLAVADGSDTPSTTLPDADDAQRFITLSRVLNARDLGGFVSKGGVLPYRRFIRADNLGTLTPEDRRSLRAEEVTTDIDLRSPGEVASARDALSDDPDIRYVHISLLGPQTPGGSAMPPDLSTLYVQALASNQPQFRQVFEAIAAAPPGAVLFHCTAGKDRTGMIAALLLSLAGVQQSTIVHNYALSAYYLKPMMSSPAMVAMMRNRPDVAPLMGSPAIAMESFLDELDHQYGGAERYLATIGLNAAQISAIASRLTSTAGGARPLP